jgi:hypothetical protein
MVNIIILDVDFIIIHIIYIQYKNISLIFSYVFIIAV